MTSSTPSLGQPLEFMVALDCPDPRELARFYARLLGWEIDPTEFRARWAQLINPHGGPPLAFQRVEGYQEPTWPERDRAQMAHLDIRVDDLDAAHEHALAAGARPLPTPADRADAPLRIYADPAGHPFCMLPSFTFLSPELEDPSERGDGATG